MNEYGYIDPEDVVDNDFYQTIKRKAEEKAKKKLQEECEHVNFVVRCSHCQKVLGSEKHYKRI